MRFERFGVLFGVGVESNQRVSSRLDRSFDRNASPIFEHESIEADLRIAYRREVSCENGRHAFPLSPLLETSNRAHNGRARRNHFTIKRVDRLDDFAIHALVRLEAELFRQDELRWETLLDGERNGRKTGGRGRRWWVSGC